jgi:hypothetical protein
MARKAKSKPKAAAKSKAPKKSKVQAKSKTRTKSKTKTAKRAAPRAKGVVAPAAGPVTLAEAKAMVMAKQPKTALRKAMPGEPTSPAEVGAARRDLEQKRRAEIAQREREYKATMEIMKQRGVRPPGAKGGVKAGAKGGGSAKKGGPTAKAASFQPLQVFAEGDSWFDYPVPFFGGGIVPRLEKRLGVPILNLAKAGDEVRYMLGVEERILLSRHLTDGCPAGGPWDVLLFSGGGNDIVDNPMALWVIDWNPNIPPEAHIHQARFGAALALVRAGFEDLIALRDQLSPNTHLIFHGYDFAIPDGRGVCFLGPWLEPTFKLRKFPNRAAMSAVVRGMLEQFAAMLTALSTPNVTFLNTQGTLSPQPSSWHNELHPSKQGFEKFALLFQAKLKALFPARVA